MEPMLPNVCWCSLWIDSSEGKKTPGTFWGKEKSKGEDALWMCSTPSVVIDSREKDLLPSPGCCTKWSWVCELPFLLHYSSTYTCAAKRCNCVVSPVRNGRQDLLGLIVGHRWHTVKAIRNSLRLIGTYWNTAQYCYFKNGNSFE